jgi:hypothetical protein
MSEVLPLEPECSLSPDSESAKGRLGKFRWRKVIFQVMKYRTFLCTLYYKRNPYNGEILDARYYWSRKQEHLIKARDYSVAVMASTGELYDRKNKRRWNRPFSIMLCVFCSGSPLQNAIRNNWICTIFCFLTKLYVCFHCFLNFMSYIAVLSMYMYFIPYIVPLFLYIPTNMN